jgi:hypothetical protein
MPIEHLKIKIAIKRGNCMKNCQGCLSATDMVLTASMRSAEVKRFQGDDSPHGHLSARTGWN